MALPIGISLFALGLAACYVWPHEVLIAFKGLAAISLLLWGMIALLVGYSERKARREYEVALKDNPAPETKATPETPSAKTAVES